MIKLPLFITGFMASAKSTIGKKIANRLRCEFIDLDQYIEDKDGRSIGDIFYAKGEDYFRLKEKEALQEVIDKKAVIALGGGTFIDDENRALIKKDGQSVFLDVSPAVLAKRLRKNNSKRPLVSKMSHIEISEYVREKLAERRPFYEEADVIIKSNNPTIKSVLNVLEQSVEN